MTTTANLNITLIDASQSQKETTSNQGVTVLDAALSGKALTMTDANYTISTSGSPADWQYFALQFAATLTAGRNVVCPTNKKLYAITNNTTGGFAITFKTSGGTGIAVAAGKSALLYCDGTNVIRLSADA